MRKNKWKTENSLSLMGLRGGGFLSISGDHFGDISERVAAHSEIRDFWRGRICNVGGYILDKNHGFLQERAFVG